MNASLNIRAKNTVENAVIQRYDLQQLHSPTEGAVTSMNGISTRHQR